MQTNASQYTNKKRSLTIIRRQTHLDRGRKTKVERLWNSEGHIQAMTETHIGTATQTGKE